MVNDGSISIPNSIARRLVCARFGVSVEENFGANKLCLKQDS
jgi:hypothetical protein